MYRPPLWAKIPLTISVQPAENERQPSLNNFWSCILDHLRAMEWHWPVMNLLAAIMGKNGTDDIASASDYSALAEGQQFSWGASKLHCNKLHCIDLKLTVTRSVVSISPCIQLHKYACNFSQIWHFLHEALESILFEPTVYFTMMKCSAVAGVGLPSHQIPPVMLNSKSFNTSLVEVMISLKNEGVFIRDLSDHTFANHVWCFLVLTRCRLEMSYCPELY